MKNGYLWIIFCLATASFYACKHKNETVPPEETTKAKTGFHFSSLLNAKNIHLEDGGNATYVNNCCSNISNAAYVEVYGEAALLTTDTTEFFIGFNVPASLSISKAESAEKLFLTNPIPFIDVQNTVPIPFLGVNLVSKDYFGVRLDYKDRNGVVWSSALKQQAGEAYFRVDTFKKVPNTSTDPFAGGYNYIIDASFACNLYHKEDSLQVKNGKLKIGIWNANFLK